ncbi:hypothetical protein M8C21_018593 [Ambrosia artemisiifolia]|uniref:Uncharacterized protein n=1 Tax=Ambrosia artemisiifolia TaxID=4212 RepID=A0AAD5GLK0_AMBAR|nr:hypothetical protein M8C21_018593 [Ambrosia artemisiifolia]
MRSFMWSLSLFKRWLGSKKSSKRRKRKLIILSDDTTSKWHVKHTGKSTTDHEEAKRQLYYDSDTPLVNLKRLCKRVVKDCQHDDPGPSRGQPSDDEEGGQTSVEVSDHSDADLSEGEKVMMMSQARKAVLFFCNRRLRQAAKNKDNNIACGVVQTRAKKGKQAIPVYDVSSSSPVRITRSRARAIEISSEKPRAKNVRPTKANKRKWAEKLWNDGLKPRVSFNALESRDTHDEGIAKWKKRRDSLDPPFTGPHTFLTLLYVDSLKCKGIDIDSLVAPMTFWTFQRLD